MFLFKNLIIFNLNHVMVVKYCSDIIEKGEQLTLLYKSDCGSYVACGCSTYFVPL